jgi:tetratricopeptide (TPR) repeat protein
VVLPTDFKIHEKRLSKDAIDSIEFQYDRLDLSSSDIKIFLNRFLKVSQSPTLPPDDFEILYLAAKVAFFLSKYDYFNTEYFQQNYEKNEGSQIWYALSLAAKGKVDESIKILVRIMKSNDAEKDPMMYIENLGVIAQIYFVRGSKYKKELEQIVEKIQQFKSEFKDKLDGFDSMFLPSSLILSRIKSQQLSPKNMVKELSSCLGSAKKAGSNYFSNHFQLDLVQANILANKLDAAKKLLDDIFQNLETLKFKAIEAKAIRVLGQWYEKSEKFDLAEKNYLIAKQNYSILEDQIGIATCVSMLANLAEQQEQASKAEQFYEEALALSEQMTDAYGMANTLTALGRVAIKKGAYDDSLEKYTTGLKIANDNKFDHLLPAIFDGLTYVNFLSGDFQTAVKNKNKSIEYKEKLDYEIRDLLIDRVRLGELFAIIDDLDAAFNEFEIALNICTKEDIKDDWYFDILNWLFEISQALGKQTLAESYIGRADLFASIHNSQEESVQALISRIRFLIQKQSFTEAEKLLASVSKQTEDMPNPLTTALALVEKAAILLNRMLEKPDTELLEKILESLDDMLFISLDLEFLPLIMFTKKVLAKILAYKQDFDEGIEELNEAVGLASDLGMKKFEDSIKADLDTLVKLKDTIESIDQEELNKQQENCLEDAIIFLRQTFWLVSASEHQRERN